MPLARPQAEIRSQSSHARVLGPLIWKGMWGKDGFACPWSGCPGKAKGGTTTRRKFVWRCTGTLCRHGRQPPEQEPFQVT